MPEKTVTFIGDIHGDYSVIRDIWDTVPSDLYIQVGDMGIGYEGLPSGKPTLFIDGNHEHFPTLKPGPMSDTIWYMPRASRIVYEGTSFNFLGGAESIDAHLRRSGVDWFVEESPTHSDMNRFFNLPPADFFVTHTCPYRVIKHMNKVAYTYIRTERAFDQLFNSLSVKPSVWVFGHWHPTKEFDVVIDGTRFICLPINGTKTFKL